MKIIDIHGLHLLDYDWYNLKKGNYSKSERLSCSPNHGVRSLVKFFEKYPGSIATILPAPTPAYAIYQKNGIFEQFPFCYENNQLMQCLQMFNSQEKKGRVLPFFGISPVCSEKKYLRYIENLIEEYPFCGFKFHPVGNQISISKLRDTRLMDILNHYKKPLLVHSGIDDFSDASQLLPLAEAYSDMNFCAAHMGALNPEFLEGINIKKNLFMDTSILTVIIQEGLSKRKIKNPHVKKLEGLKGGTELNLMGLLNKTYGIEKKVIFGSDERWATYFGSSREKEIEFIRKMDYPSGSMQRLLYDNGKVFLGI